MVAGVGVCRSDLLGRLWKCYDSDATTHTCAHRACEPSGNTAANSNNQPRSDGGS